MQCFYFDGIVFWCLVGFWITWCCYLGPLMSLEVWAIFKTNTVQCVWSTTIVNNNHTALTMCRPLLHDSWWWCEPLSYNLCQMRPFESLLSLLIHTFCTYMLHVLHSLPHTVNMMKNECNSNSDNFLFPLTFPTTINTSYTFLNLQTSKIPPPLRD